MAGEIYLTIIGNLTADPELRFTPSGKCVADFTVASTPRSFDRSTNEWKDGESVFIRCSVWNEQAENVSNSLRKGMRVIVTGTLRQRKYETPSGEQRSVMELQIDEVGPSLRRAVAQVTRTGAQGHHVNAYSGQQTPNSYQPSQPASEQQAPAQQQASVPDSQSNGGMVGSPFANSYQPSQPPAQPPQGWGGYAADQNQPAPF